MSEVAQSFAEELAFAKDLAAEAGVIAMRYFAGAIDVKLKPDQSPVTEADETINQLVIDACKQRYPDYGVLGEEDSWHTGRSRKWICDPIDGTADYVQGKPDFMFSLSLDYDGKPVLAVTLHPVSNDLYWAIAGGGAFLNGQPIQVSARSFSESKLVFPTNNQVLVDYAPMYKQLTDQSQSVTRIHSSIYKAMKIADGTYDGAVWPKTVHPWDVHSAQLIITEAGGAVTDISGQPYERYDQELQNGLIFSNQVIQPDLIRIAR